LTTRKKIVSKDIYLENQILSDTNFYSSELRINGCQYENVSFYNCTIHFIWNSTFKGCVFSDCIINEISFSSLGEVYKSKIIGAVEESSIERMNRSVILNSRLVNSFIKELKICYLRNSEFENCDMPEILNKNYQYRNVVFNGIEIKKDEDFLGKFFD